jgi:Transposase
MLADELDYVVGVDPHRDTHALAIVHAATGAALFEAEVAASERGYAQALSRAEREAPGRRAWAIEGTGSYGAGLARFLTARGERVLEVGRARRERRSHAKTDALDALRAARSVLGEAQLASPRAAGEREALRALMVARAGALAAKKAGLCQLRALLVTCPEPLRSELRSLTRARLLRRLAAVRPDRHRDAELRGTLIALRALARRVQVLTAEEGELKHEIQAPVAQLAPPLLDEPASARSRPRKCCSRGRTAAASALRPPSLALPAPPRSPPLPAASSATGSTAAATGSSTARFTRSSSAAARTTRRRSATSSAKPKRVRACARQCVASSATSPAISSACSRQARWPLDTHRSIPRT